MVGYGCLLGGGAPQSLILTFMHWLVRKLHPHRSACSCRGSTIHTERAIAVRALVEGGIKVYRQGRAIKNYRDK